MDPQTKPGAPAAVDVEAGVRPGENALRPFRAQQLLADKHRRDLAGKDLGETRVVDPLGMTPGTIISYREGRSFVADSTSGSLGTCQTMPNTVPAARECNSDA